MQGMVPLSGFGGVPYSAVRKAAPRNLLDNSDFTNPVNQRGKTSYSNPGYSIDRWKITNNYSSVTVDNDGVTFSANGGMCYPQQLIVANTNMVGKTFTAAICLKDGSVTVTSGVLTALSPASNTLVGNRVAITNGNGAELAMYARTDGNLMIQPHIPDGVSLGLRWAALYEGSYTAETLPEYQPKGYGVELAECQRYYQRFHYEQYETIAMGFEAPAYAFIQLSGNNMRLKFPTITISAPIQIGSRTYMPTGCNINNGTILIGLNYDTTTTNVGACYAYCPSAGGCVIELNEDL